jgi:hypothetical protein
MKILAQRAKEFKQILSVQMRIIPEPEKHRAIFKASTACSPGKEKPTFVPLHDAKERQKARRFELIAIA